MSSIIHPSLLNRELDWDNYGVDRDLKEIADHMPLYWEQLSFAMGLTRSDIYDINSFSRTPVERRYLK